MNPSAPVYEDQLEKAMASIREEIKEMRKENRENFSKLFESVNNINVCLKGHDTEIHNLKTTTEKLETDKDNTKNQGIWFLLGIIGSIILGIINFFMGQSK